MGLNGTVNFTALKEIKQLQTLDLENNSLSGTVPEEMSQTSAIVFFLGSNKFHGSIPKALTANPQWNLDTLNLDNNQLTGQIPSGFGNMPSPTVLSFNHNKLNGTIPEDLGFSTSINTLRFSFNELTGTIPKTGWMQDAGNWADWLTFDNNKLTGTIPLNLTKLPLIVLNLTNNSLNGSVPDGVCGENWDTIDLGYNKLTGTLPSCLGAAPDGYNMLTNFDVSHNQIKGTIPKMIGNLSMTATFQLQNNQLEGAIPRGIINMTSLNFLGIGNNNFSGKLPPLDSSKIDAIYFSRPHNGTTLEGGRYDASAPLYVDAAASDDKPRPPPPTPETQDLYKFLVELGGYPYRMESGWNDADACPKRCNGTYHPKHPNNGCTWEGVFCTAGKVTQIHLNGMGLNGTIDLTALEGMEQLQVLDVSNNNLKGPIRGTIGTIDIILFSSSYLGTMPTPTTMPKGGRVSVYV
jgi:Leucine-rich repeat (LRR) protein